MFSQEGLGKKGKTSPTHNFWNLLYVPLFALIPELF
jgi:hypothetical protein